MDYEELGAWEGNLPHTFSALMKKPGTESYWTPMFLGGSVAARRWLDSFDVATEVSVYRDGRFIKTIVREEEK